MSLARQKAFNIFAPGLLRQARRSATPNGDCLYRCGELRCAIGFLISDEDYGHSDLYAEVGKSSPEGLSVRHLNLYWPGDSLHGLDKPFLTAAQHIHDNVLPRYWFEALEKFAKYWGLNDSCLETWHK